MTALEGLGHGLAVALQPTILIYSLLGAVLGTLVGVLPGIGAMAAITLLLPITYYISAEAALVMLAAVYYGAQYGGAVAKTFQRGHLTPSGQIGSDMFSPRTKTSHTSPVTATVSASRQTMPWRGATALEIRTVSALVSRMPSLSRSSPNARSAPMTPMA